MARHLVTDSADGPARLMWVLDLRGSDPKALAMARRWVADKLVGLGTGHLQDVLMVTVELLTNAYDHGGGPRELRMARSLHPCAISIAVADHNGARPEVGNSRFGAAANRGRGLLLVRNLSQDWGVTSAGGDWSGDGSGSVDASGKTVWARVGCAANPCPRPQP